MDIVKLFQDIANKYNADNKCGFCWSFGAPLTESGINASENTDLNKCCVKMFLTDLVFEKGFAEDNQKNSYPTHCDYIFNLWVGLPTNLGINNYNETPNHLITESNWATIYKTLIDCVGCGFNENFCRDFGVNLSIKKWRLNQVIKFGDDNLCGYKINGHFRVYL
jgi:hypothetical protein